MNLVIFLLSIFVIEITAEIGLSLKTLISKGLSLKNLMLYLFFVAALFQVFTKGDFNRIGALKNIHLPFILLVIVGALSIAYTASMGSVHHYDVMHAIGVFKGGLFDLYLFFFLYSYLVKTEKNAHWLIGTFIWVLVAGSALTVAESFYPLLNIFGFDGGSIRPNGPMGEPNQSGAVFALFLPVIFALFFSGSKMKKFAYSIAIIVVFIALILTSSRGGLLGALIGIGLFLWFVRKDVTLNRQVLLVIFTLFFLVFCWLLVPESYQDLLLSRLEFTGLEKRDIYYASAGRTYVWEKGLKFWLKSPFLGYGWASFNFLTKQTSHNTFLEILVGLGIIGLSIYLYLFWQLFKTIHRTIEFTTKPKRVFLLGVIAGLCGFMIAIFFVNLYRPWFFVWGFIGVIVSYCSLITIEAKE